jgi:hypothetical protein
MGGCSMHSKQFSTLAIPQAQRVPDTSAGGELIGGEQMSLWCVIGLKHFWSPHASGENEMFHIFKGRIARVTVLGTQSCDWGPYVQIRVRKKT